MKKLMIKNVQCAFPSVYEPNTYYTPHKRELTLLLDKVKHASDIYKINHYASSAASTKNPLKDGDSDNARQEYRGHMYIKATNPNQFPIVDRRKNRLTPQTQDISGGDVLNVAIILNAFKDDSSGETICYARVTAIQYVCAGVLEVDQLADFEFDADTPF